MSQSNIRNPPLLENYKAFDEWEKSIKLWQLITDLKPEKQASAIVLSLKGKARETVLQLPYEEIAAADGVNKIVSKLGTLFMRRMKSTQLMKILSDSYILNVRLV